MVLNRPGRAQTVGSSSVELEWQTVPLKLSWLSNFGMLGKPLMPARGSTALRDVALELGEA